MKLVLRLVFLCLIAAALWIQLGRTEHNQSVLSEQDQLVINLKRLGFRQVVTDGSDLVVAIGPRCAAPVTVLVAGLDGGTDDWARELVGHPGLQTRYIYLGLVTEQPDRRAMAEWRFWAGLLTTMGLRRSAAPNDFLLVLSAKDCRDLEHLDWSVLSPWQET